MKIYVFLIFLLENEAVLWFVSGLDRFLNVFEQFWDEDRHRYVQSSLTYMSRTLK